MSMTNEHRRALDERGYVLLERFMDKSLLRELGEAVERQFAAEGDAAGSEFKQEPGARRLANLVDKADVFRRIIVESRLLEYVQHVLGPAIKLSSLNARSANAMTDCAQPLHADMAAIADERGFWVCNTVWMLTDFTVDNGAIRVVPGSHHAGRLPADALDDPRAAQPGEVLLTGRAGDVVIMNAHLWHGATANHTPNVRTAVHAFYCRRDKPQQQYQKKLLREAVQAKLTDHQRWILAIDDEENDRVSAEVAVRSGFMK